MTLIALNSVLTILALRATIPAARCAESTEIPPWLRGNIEIRYDLDYVGGSLTEDNTIVGEYYRESHLITYSFIFAPAPGVALFMDLPQYVNQSLGYPNANQMVYDPSIESGTMLGTDPLGEQPLYSGSGLGGLWMGIRGTPFSEAFPRRGNLVTWLAELAYRYPDHNNFFTVTDDRRGAGPGGSAIKLHMAFSTTHRPAQPYISATFTRQSSFEADLYDENGEVLVAGESLDAPNIVTIRTGVELTAFENTASDAFFNFDLRLGYGYQSWQTIPSGLLLPSVLSSSKSIAVTESEYSHVMAGLGLYYRAFEYFQINLVGDIYYHTPHILEHTYDVSTGSDSVGANIFTELKVLIR